MADTPPADDLAVAPRSAARTPIADRLAALEQAERDRAEAELVAQAPLPVDADLDAYAGEEPSGGLGLGVHLSFRSRLTLGLVAASVLPLAGFGIVALVMHDVTQSTDTLGRLLLLGLVLAALVGAGWRRDGERWTLSRLAEAARLSPYHYLRTFTRLTGVTPHQFVLRTRLRAAAIRLAADDAKVIEIALESGFNDVSNFNRAFREEIGVAPREYRRRSRS